MALDTNLVAYYKLDWNSNDSLGVNNWTDTSVSYVAGKIWNAGSFNGTSSYIKPPSGSIRPTGNFTINAWINTNGLYSTWQQVFATYSQLTPSLSWFRIGLQENTNKLYLISGKNTWYVLNTDYKALLGTTTIPTWVWTMVTWVYNGSTLEVFVNWVSDGSTTWTNAPVYQADSKPTIGANNFQQSLFVEFFNGKIDELWIWSDAKSWSEITQLYNGWAWLTYPFTQSSNKGFQLFF